MRIDLYAMTPPKALLDRPSPKDIIRLLHKAVVVDGGYRSPCWAFSGCRTAKGYGLFWFSGSSRRAHRVAYAAFKAPVPDEMEVAHMCHNEWCINPDHLDLAEHGTQNNDHGGGIGDVPF